MKFKIFWAFTLFCFILASPLFSEDKAFDAFKLTYHAGAFLDYGTTFYASRFPEFQEEDAITRLYWRSPPAFCAFKAVETLILDKFFTWIHSKSKILGYLTVAVFAIARFIAFKENLEVIR
ncbi:MAG: hypothetical protein ACFFCW_22870 [Candidatus Hodarchaeota archaeon]